MKRLILIHGDKGGTGKTHVAQLTAAVFRSVGHPLLLVDGDAKNAGLYRSFTGKPDEVLKINIRKPEGVDALIERFADETGDVLVDLPAAGSDMTTRMTKAGSAEGAVDIRELFPQMDARLVIMFVIDQSRDAVVALDAEIKALSSPVTDWIIVRNHRLDDVPFDRFEKWQEPVDLSAVPVIDMHRLDRRVTEALVSAKMNLTELNDLPTASAMMKIRGQTALRAWTEELRKAKVLND